MSCAENGEQISFYEKLDEVEAKAPDFFSVSITVIL